MEGRLIRDPWGELRRYTQARIALGRAGVSLPTRAVLEFGLAHAAARDAVHQPLDLAALEAALQAAGQASMVVHSAAPDRAAYLRRPDWGRRLDDASRARLQARQPAPACPLALVLADGLSALALSRHAPALLEALRGVLPEVAAAPAVVALQGRVAIGDEIGALLGAGQVLVLIGERPGLSSPDSLGAYLTHTPRPGRSDAERNCVSNIRPEGLGYAAAAAKLAYLIRGARALGCTGVTLKDDSPAGAAVQAGAHEGWAPSLPEG